MSIKIAIDGPAGAGKSTIAKAAAAAFGFVYVDTGAIYRAVAYHIKKSGGDVSDADAVAELLGGIKLKLLFEAGTQHVYVNGEDVTGRIRTPEISMATSVISKIPAVRSFLFDMQREIADSENVVMDGRDIGTVVMPDAQLKIFLTASPQARAQRRFKELADSSVGISDALSCEKILEDIIRRDREDSTRDTAPLRQAEDAIVLDTTRLTLDESIEAVNRLIKKAIDNELCSYHEEEIPCGGIYAHAYIPEKGGVLPALILSHGYNSCCADLDDMASAAAENGFFACSFDFIGGSVRSKSGGSSLDMSIRTECNDLNAVIDKLKADPRVGNIYLYGESQGGFVSAVVSSRRDDISGLVLLYPAFCIPDDWRGKKIPPEGIDFMGLKISPVFLRDMPDWDICGKAESFHNPVLIMHGDRDSLVSPDYSRRAAEHYPDACLKIFEGEGHGFSPAARAKAVDNTVSFLRRHIK